MTDFEELLREPIHRRHFLEWLVDAAKTSAVLPLAVCYGSRETRATTVSSAAPSLARSRSGRMPSLSVPDDTQSRILLKDGLIVDGTGKQGFSGDLLIRGETIEIITPGEIIFDGPTVDCGGKVVSPGLHRYALPYGLDSSHPGPFGAQDSVYRPGRHHLRGGKLWLRNRRVPERQSLPGDDHQPHQRNANWRPWVRTSTS